MCSQFMQDLQYQVGHLNSQEKKCEGEVEEEDGEEGFKRKR